MPKKRKGASQESQKKAPKKTKKGEEKKKVASDDEYDLVKAQAAYEDAEAFTLLSDDEADKPDPVTPSKYQQHYYCWQTKTEAVNATRVALPR